MPDQPNFAKEGDVINWGCSVSNKGEVRELPDWLGNAVLSVIQQLGQDIREKRGSVENVQILIDAIKACKNKLTPLAQAGQNEDDLGRSRKSGTSARRRFAKGFISKSLREYRSHVRILIRMLN